MIVVQAGLKRGIIHVTFSLASLVQERYRQVHISLYTTEGLGNVRHSITYEFATNTEDTKEGSED